MEEGPMKAAIALAKEAGVKDKAGEYEAALSLYTRSLENWQLVSKYQTNKELKERLCAKMTEYIERAEEIREHIQKRKEETHPNKGKGRNCQRPSPSPANEESARMKSNLLNAITMERPSIKWEDVAGLESAKECLQEAVILPSRFPILFANELKPWKGILLYGPPGTGKTHLAKACATEAAATFFCVSASDIMSKWQGESERLVRALFEAAAESSPAVIFIDEVDSMCSARSGGDTDSARRVKTEFLVRMQGIGSNEGTLVLGASNVPWELDPGVRRRFEKRIYIPLPDVRARKRLFETHLGSAATVTSKSDMNDLAVKTDGYSGADISIVVRDALFQPILQTQRKRSVPS
eukprot:GHVO01022105.1.p1 GENE.GHVO01022105.1~~GHVO01022105.1.p1  ORF type:complete len:352 (+),score=50.53 GHVO01022105.1:28-1083(+)